MRSREGDFPRAEREFRLRTLPHRQTTLSRRDHPGVVTAATGFSTPETVMPRIIDGEASSRL